jgi:hypothetical protein
MAEIAVQKGDEVKVVEQNGKFYLKTQDDKFLSNATVLGSSGKKNARKYVFDSKENVDKYLAIKGFYEEGTKPEPVVEQPAVEEPVVEEKPAGEVVDTDIGRVEKADEIVEKDIVEELTDVDLGDSEEAKAAEEALVEVAESAAAAFGGEEIGDVTQTSEAFTKETAIAEQTALTQEDVDKAIQNALEQYQRDVQAKSEAEAAAQAEAEAAAQAAAEEAAKVSTKTSVLTSVPQAVQTVASGTATGGKKEKAAAKSIGPAEDKAIESYTTGRRSTILTEPGGLLTSTDETSDRRLRSRRSLLAG